MTLVPASSSGSRSMSREDIAQIVHAVNMVNQRKERGRSRQYEDNEPELPGFKLLQPKRAKGAPPAPSAPPAAAGPTGTEEENTQESAANPNPSPAKPPNLFVAPPIEDQYAIEDKKNPPAEDPEKIAKVYEQAADQRTNPKAKAMAKPKPQAMAKAKAKSKAKTKQSDWRNAKGGWRVETRHREDGQTDRYYYSPKGRRFRIRTEAFAHGYSV